MANHATVFSHWRRSLLNLYNRFERLRSGTRFFYAKAFAVFVALNLACFWWAFLTAYSKLLFHEKAWEYALTGFPVAVLGAVFDCLSLLVTLYIVRRALASSSNLSFFGYLTVDLLIAVLATLWVLFVFILSGWLISLIVAQPETLMERGHLYENRLWGAIENPFARHNLKNIYFGTIMGASALIPSLVHIFLACRSLARSGVEYVGHVRGRSGDIAAPADRRSGAP